MLFSRPLTELLGGNPAGPAPVALLRQNQGAQLLLRDVKQGKADREGAPTPEAARDNSMQIVILGGTAQPHDHWHHLERWWERPFNCGDTHTFGAVFDKHERIVAVEPPGPMVPGGPFERVAHAIMRYDIFPPHIGSGLFKDGHLPVRQDDVVGLRYKFLPGLDLIFASRVIQVIDEPDRRGFTYRTLKWHPEKGEETFLVRKNLETGEVRASLNAWSAPALFLTSLIYPLARRLQLAAGRAALDHLEGIATGPQSFQSPR